MEVARLLKNKLLFRRCATYLFILSFTYWILTSLEILLMIEIIDLHFQNQAKSIAAFMIETSTGPIIIETGPHSTIANIEKALSAKGYQLKDVQHVFLTHIHMDHAGAAWVFAEHGATIYVHPFGEKHLIDPSKLVSSAKRIYQENMDRLWGQFKPIPKAQLKTVVQGEKITIGGVELIAWNTPGHAVHHIAWQIGKKLIAGDVAGVKIGANGMIVPPCPPPDINIEHWMSSIDLLEQLDLDTIYLTHFGKVTDIPAHFKALRLILLDWANWMRPHFDKGSDPKEVTPLFVQYVKNQLIEFGISKEDIVVYEHANPSWMSVVGLLRYWKKKMEKMG